LEFSGIKGEPAHTSIHDKGQKGEPGLDGVQGMIKIIILIQITPECNNKIK